MRLADDGATVPTVTLVLFGVGLGLAGKRFLREKPVRRRPDRDHLLWALALAVSYVAWLSTDTPSLAAPNTG